MRLRNNHVLMLGSEASATRGTWDEALAMGTFILCRKGEEEEEGGEEDEEDDGEGEEGEGEDDEEEEEEDDDDEEDDEEDEDDGPNAGETADCFTLL